MTYFVYRLFETPLRRVEPLGAFERYAEASRFAKARRAEESADRSIRIVFGANALEAEEALMNPQPPPPRIGDDY
ncbi:MAG: hypothetical protein EPO27_19895 [Betaproteobacteria bacterium]|nr:MAG: hypothetical protein EPO27_19895 [Betaproteobacteria bacterium]